MNPRRLAILGLVLAALLPLPDRARALREPDEFDFGPLCSRLRDPTGGVHLKIAGPLFERACATNSLRLLAVRPLWSGADEVVGDKSASECLWPVAFAWQFRDSFSSRILVSWYTRYNTAEQTNHWRWTLFPIWYQGRDKQGHTYAALFPVGGSIHEFLLQDQMDFVLFPLYGHARKMDADSYHVLWPVFCRENSPRNDRFRVWPLYGWNIRAGEYDKRFCLWPFFTWARYDRPGTVGRGYLIFPLWGHIHLENQESWMFLPPFIKFGHSDKYSMGYCPWPFIQWSTGETRKLYFWPLWGSKDYKHIHSGFYLWPLGWYRRLMREDLLLRRYTFVPFWFGESGWRQPKDPAQPAQCATRYWHFWPLCSYERAGDQLRFRTLMLWPMRHTAPIEREYAPLWTLYTHTAAGANADDEVLWGLIRHQRRGAAASSTSIFPLVEWGRNRDRDVRDWSVLKGLVGYERAGDRRTVRLLWFLRFGGSTKK